MENKKMQYKLEFVYSDAFTFSLLSITHVLLVFNI